MINNRICDSDVIILQSVESYLRSMNVPMAQNPQERIMVTQQARDYLYSDIVQRVPRVAAYILSTDMEVDTIAQGLNISLSKHVMDPIFINILMQYLSKRNNAEENAITGAYLAKVLNKWLETNINKKVDKTPTTPTTTKKGEKESTSSDVTTKPEANLEQVAHIKNALNQLLGNITSIVSTKSPTLTYDQSLAIAACIAMNNGDTIKEIIASDFPVTADIFDIVSDPSNIIKSALLLEKNDLPNKPTTNQTAFMESLKRWVYNKLNIIPTQTSYQFLVATYGSASSVNVSTKFINPKDCGTMYSNLLTVAKQLINK